MASSIRHMLKEELQYVVRGTLWIGPSRAKPRRYGVTPVLNKTVLRTKALNYFVAVSTPMRAGNSEPTSIGANLQIGCIFN